MGSKGEGIQHFYRHTWEFGILHLGGTKIQQRLANLEKGSPKSKGKSGGRKKGKQSEKKKCPHCGKVHRGECWKLKNKGNNKSYKRQKIDTDNLQVIAEHFGLTPVAASNDEGTWREGLTPTKKVFVMGVVSQEQDYSSSNISVDSETLHVYKPHREPHDPYQGVFLLPRTSYVEISTHGHVLLHIEDRDHYPPFLATQLTTFGLQ